MPPKGRSFKKAPQRGPRINHLIKAREVRVITDDNQALGVLSVNDALEKAREMGLDLVEISPNADPPVCKIVDYGKFKYLQKKKEHDTRKRQTVTLVKEVKFKIRTDVHDMEYKLKNVRRFLEEGNKVKLSLRFVGREIIYPEKGEETLREVAEQVEDLGKIDLLPKRAGRTMSLVLSPVGKAKKGESKDNGKAKAQDE